MSDGRTLEFGMMVGSLRKGSLNRRLAEAMMGMAPDGVRFEHLPPIGDLPHYDQDVFDEAVPEPVERLSAAIRAKDGLVIAVPEYNYSFPGVLKNAIDWVCRTKPQPFAGKPVFLMSASPSVYGGVRGQLQLRQVLMAVNALCLPRPEIMVRQADEKFDGEGRLTDERTGEFLEKAVAALAEHARRLA